ncbi:MAG: PhzF family phenazine biosynthesis protein [Flammeovirgaceae bacterium]
MNTFHFYHLDSFAFAPFRGNPAGVVVLDGPEWPQKELLQKVAAELNLPATAFIIPDEVKSKIRWFSPTLEIQLCGHASLAAGAVLLQKLFPNSNQMILDSLYSGELPIRKRGNRIQLDFPRDFTKPLANLPATIPASWRAVQAHQGKVLFIELDSQKAVQNFPYDRQLIAALDPYTVVITAKSADPHYDFVSRVFEPNIGIDEDPVTGSAHCGLADLWSKKLGKKQLRAAQLSERMGELELEVLEDRVLITGQVAFIMEGKIAFPHPKKILA